ncbi:MAG: DUF3501 family protein, partial [Rhodospirillales bacterium]|nr:DUF3501 family protein [Rhodospirillales bacterium]
MTTKTELTKEDILDLAAYEEIRIQRRAEIAELKKPRRLSVGPYATFYFECYDTMWYQVHEMLRIEKGGEEQLKDELLAYNPLIPNGNELVATVMFEIDDTDKRHLFLSDIGGVENSFVLEIDGDSITATPEDDVERTNEAGKASSVQFIHFQLSDTQITKFKKADARVMVGINHPNYGHMT